MSDTTILLRKPTDLLRRDHERVKELFVRYEAVDRAETARKRELFLEIGEEILIHSRVEETLFYPAVEKADPERVRKALEDHRDFRPLLEELKEMDAGDEGFDAKMKELRKRVERHARMEESEIFPLAMKLPNKTLRELSAEIGDLRDDLRDRGAGEDRPEGPPFYPTLGMPDGGRRPSGADPRTSPGYENWGSE